MASSDRPASPKPWTAGTIATPTQARPTPARAVIEAKRKRRFGTVRGLSGGTPSVPSVRRGPRSGGQRGGERPGVHDRERLYGPRERDVEESPAALVGVDGPRFDHHDGVE